ncbi:hypothetical protein B0H14DRAFT_2576971 [Mycena olivaceomarginata]|nr:hypothetical protein B0H14DRAFT_2576971 [Mycena olivaceomarginata]
MTQEKPLAKDASKWAFYANTSPFLFSRRILPLRLRLDVPARLFRPPHRQLLSARILKRETNRPHMSDIPGPSRRIPRRWDTLPSRPLTELRLITLKVLTTPHRRFPRSSSILRGWPQLSLLHSKVIMFLKATPLWYLITLYPAHLFSSEASSLFLFGQDTLGRRPNNTNAFTPDHAIFAGVGNDSGQREAMKCFESRLKCLKLLE